MTLATAAQLRRQGRIGLALSAVLISAWLCTHIFGVFWFAWSTHAALAVPLLVALQCWLNVGLFIVAHDCMHGSLAPFQPRLNRGIGRVCLILYAGFWFDGMLPKHLRHHTHSGTALDPDFNAAHPDRFAPWFATFLTEYFSWRQLAVMAFIALTYVLVLHARVANVITFWALPAIMSAVQLFTFGTYLPHRHQPAPFASAHRARSSDYGWLVSLLTCFHFGYHHEHHARPSLPWWGLPGARREKT